MSQVPTMKKPNPTYEQMIINAIVHLAERSGSSRQSIKKYILANNEVKAGPRFNALIAAAIVRGTKKELFVLPKGPLSRIKLLKPTPKSKAKAQTQKAEGSVNKALAKKAGVKKVAPAKKTASKVKKEANQAKIIAPTKRAAPTKREAPTKRAAPTKRTAPTKRGPSAQPTSKKVPTFKEPYVLLPRTRSEAAEMSTETDRAESSEPSFSSSMKVELKDTFM